MSSRVGVYRLGQALTSVIKISVIPDWWNVQGCL